jgi:hypothetical protein
MESKSWWEKTKPIIDLFSGIAVIFTLLVITLQWWEMHEGGVDTHDLAVAAKSQAEAAKTQADNTAKLAQAAVDQVTKLQAGVDQTHALAVETKNVVTEAHVSNLTAADADRPWMGALFTSSDFEDGKVPTYTLTFGNSGRRPAKLIDTSVGAGPFVTFPVEPKYDIASTPSTGLVVPGQSAVTTWSGNIVNFSQASIPGQTFYVFGKIDYRDVRTGKAYWTHVCWQYDLNVPNVKPGFYNCSQYNDAK